MNATSIGVPAIGAPGARSMYRNASSTAGRSAAGRSAGSGRLSPTPTLWPGLMPHVTVGSISPAKR